MLFLCSLPCTSDCGSKRSNNYVAIFQVDEHSRASCAIVRALTKKDMRKKYKSVAADQTPLGSTRLRRYVLNRTGELEETNIIPVEFFARIDIQRLFVCFLF